MEGVSTDMVLRVPRTQTSFNTHGQTGKMRTKTQAETRRNLTKAYKRQRHDKCIVHPLFIQLFSLSTMRLTWEVTKKRKFFIDAF